MADVAFKQLETVQRGLETVLLRGVRRSDGVAVLLKVVPDGGALPLRRLLKEREIGKIPDPSTILVPLDLASLDGRPALVLEDFGGRPLEDELSHPMEVAKALRIASLIASKLGELHARGVVHRDVKPQNVFVDPSTGEVRLTGLGVALTTAGPYQPSSEPGLIEGTFAYMAPEQTRPNGGLVDPRADLYSLGVVLYRMLAGRLPLEATDALGWIHAHIARRAPPVTTFAPDAPPIVAAIVAKLLAKDPEERYQTAGGLVADLERCLSMLRAGSAPEPFPLGLHDVPERLRIPRRLRGREAELRALGEALAEARSGASKLVLLVGPAGIGKTLLAKALEAETLSVDGVFLEGKHDELSRDVPYFAIAQALDQLASRLLMSSEEQLAAWRARLSAALGPNASLLGAIAPRFALIVGDGHAPAAAKLVSPDRFKVLFQRLLTEIASDARPLVLFLDDLQWADPATLGLLELLEDPSTRHVLVIGAWRGDDLPPDSALAGAVARLGAQGAVRIDVPPLSPFAIAELLVDAFRCTVAEATGLARVLHERTCGNPLFVEDLLRRLHQDGLVWFDRQQGRWRWDLERIRRVPLADGAAELLLGKIGELPGSLQDVLRVGACIGAEFCALAVAEVLDRPMEQVARDLVEAASQGLLVQTPTTFRFPHDRVREAAYSLVPIEDRPRVHHRIGRVLLARVRDHEEAGFVVADQLNRAASLMTTRAERLELASIDLAAGRKAKAASAYASAAQYLAAGMAVLDADAWEDAYEVVYGLHLERAACELVLGRLDDAERLLAVVMQHARTPVDKAPAYSMLVELCMTRGEVGAATRLGVEGLRACGVDLPERASREEALAALEEAMALLGEHGPEALATLPCGTDAAATAATELMSHVGAPLYYEDKDLFAVIASRSLAMTLRRGMTEASPSIIAGFALALGALTERYDDAWRIGRVAYEMVQRPELSLQKPLVCLVFATLLNYWVRHVRTNLPYLEEALEAGRQLGDPTYVCYAASHLVLTRFVSGAKLTDVEVESERHLSCVRAFGYDEMADLMLSRHLVILSLRGKTTALGSLGTPERDEAALDAHFETECVPLTRCWHYIDKLTVEVIAGRFDRAVTAGRAAAALLHTSRMFPVVGEHAFYYALALASAQDGSRDDAVIDECREQLRRWADACPENFAHKHALVSAEVARLRGDDFAAMHGYERAIQSAHDNGFIHVAALAYELAARFYRGRGFTQFADTYLREARRCYASWGATAKVQALDDGVPPAESLAHAGSRAASETVSAPHEALDLLTVMRASQALSAELVRETLIEQLLAVMLPYSGARWCCFVAADDARCVAEMTVPPRSAATSPGVPESVIHWVRRTRERVLLHDARSPNPFSSDPYVRSRRPRSILCLPLVRNERLHGVIYLENDLVPGVFGAKRVTVLELLARQAAISLESAALFAALQRENAQRRRVETSLRQSQDQLRAILENMVDAVIACDRDGRITLVNQAAVRLLGLADREGIPSVRDLTRELRARHPDGRAVAPSEIPLLRALDGEVVESFEATITDRFERDIALRTSAAPIRDEEGNIVGAVEAAADVTEKGELDRLRDQFLRMAAHELKTPVAVVSGYAELLQARREQLAPAQQRMLDALVRGARRIDRIIADLLFMWQLRLGRIALVGEQLELGELLRRVASRCEPPPDEPRVRVSATEPIVLSGDRQLLEQVFTHLIDNALRYSPRGGPVEVRVASSDHGGAEVSVRDHGIGIPKAKQARIFEPFYRAHADTEHDFGGMGIGLYVAKVIVNRHGGSLTFESREGEGSTFTVRLPAQTRGS